MFQSVAINDFLYRVTYDSRLAGYIQVVVVHEEIRYKARLLHKRHAKLGASLGEYFSLEHATDAFKVFEPLLLAGETIFDTSTKTRRR